MFFTEGFSGRMLRSFFSRTMDLRAASRASWRCAGVSLSARVSFDQGTRSGGAKNPQRKRRWQKALTPRSKASAEKRGFCTGEGSARDSRALVNGEVLGWGNSFQIVRVVALQAGNECHADAAGEKRIFSVGFLAAPPARVAKDVDIGRPKGETEVPPGVSALNCIIVFGARFAGDHIGDAMDQLRVPRGRKANGLGEDGGITRAGDAVQPPVPPVVCRNAETRNGGGDILHLRGFFLESHAGDKIVHAFVERETRIQIRRRFLRCRTGRRGLRRQVKGAEQHKKQNRKKRKESVGHRGRSLSVAARHPLTVALGNPREFPNARFAVAPMRKRL